VANPGNYKVIVWVKDKKRTFGKVIEANLVLPETATLKP
jgi:hypothetical protein